MSSIKPDDGGSEINSAEESVSAFVIPCGDASELLEFGEEILDQVSGLVHVLIIDALLFPVVPWRNDAPNARFFQQVKHARLRIIGFVGHKRLNACEKIRQ